MCFFPLLPNSSMNFQNAQDDPLRYNTIRHILRETFVSFPTRFFIKWAEGKKKILLFLPKQLQEMFAYVKKKIKLAFRKIWTNVTLCWKEVNES